MLSNDGADRDAIPPPWMRWTPPTTRWRQLSFDTLTHPELLAVLDRLETLSRKQPVVEHRLIGRLAAEASPTELGATAPAEVLWRRLRQPRRGAPAHRRSRGSRSTTGVERRAIGAPACGDGCGSSAWGDQLPGWVDHQTREQAEATLGRIAAGLGPDELRQAADRLMALLDQDGEPPTDAERARPAT